MNEDGRKLVEFCDRMMCDKDSSESFLEKFADGSPLFKEVYGGDEKNKPNDHCYWGKIGSNVFGWIESDAYFRERVLLWKDS